MIESMKVKLIGLVPTIMHNGRLSDPDDPITIELSPLLHDRKKTNETLEKIAELKFIGSLYMNDDGEYIWPGCNVESMLGKGSWKGGTKLSKAESRAVFFCDDFVLTKFDGPKDPEERMKDPRCRDRRSVVIDKKRVMTVRPIFKNWVAEGIVNYNTSFIVKKDVQALFVYCGEIIGLSDFRPKFGRFDVKFGDA